jgi:hypothetical protein
MTDAARDPLALPNWPALMDEAMASAYLDVAPATFRAIAARAKVAPVDLGHRLTRWRRRDLDALVDKLPARSNPAEPQAANQPDPADAADEALRRAERRARR